jgi:hypothetical protein
VGTIFGHEFTGIVEEVGGNMQNPKPDDHVLVPSNISAAPAASARASCIPPATTSIRKRPRSAVSTAVRTPQAVTTAARRSTCACRSPTSDRRRFPGRPVRKSPGARSAAVGLVGIGLAAWWLRRC